MVTHRYPVVTHRYPVITHRYPVVSTRTPTGGRPNTHHDIYGRKFIFKFSTTQMQKLLQEAKEKNLGVPEGNFKLYPVSCLHETYTIDINPQVTWDSSGNPLKTSSSHRRIYVQPKVLRAVLEMTPRSKETTKL